jgi:hypothetical protein
MQDGIWTIYNDEGVGDSKVNIYCKDVQHLEDVEHLLLQDVPHFQSVAHLYK